MRHQHGIHRLNRTGSHRRALLRNLTVALLEHGRIETTLAKAKALRPFAERLITLGKRGDLHARRLAARHIRQVEALRKLFGEVAERFANRPGGYTRILRLRTRVGDQGTVAMIELVEAMDAPAAAVSVDAPAT